MSTASAATVAAQGPVADPDGRRLRMGVDSLAIYLVRGSDTSRTGAVRDEQTVVQEGGRALLRRVYVSVDRVLGSRVDTLVDQLTDLRPVRHRSHTAQAYESIDFTATHTTGWLRLANGDSVAVNAPPTGAYNASSFDMVLRSSSLREGWEADVPTFLPAARAVAPMRARVTGVQYVGGEPCWRVEADFSGMTVTFWIDQKTRMLRQQTMQVRPDVQILFRAVVAPAGKRAE